MSNISQADKVDIKVAELEAKMSYFKAELFLLELEISQLDINLTNKSK